MRKLHHLSIFCGCLFATSTLAIEKPQPPAIQFSPQIQRALDWSGQTVTHSHEKDGMQVADHNGGMQNVVFTRIADDGSIEYYCTDNLETAQAWLSDSSKGRQNLPIIVRPDDEVKQ